MTTTNNKLPAIEIEWRSVGIDTFGDATLGSHYATQAEATADARRLVADGDYPAAIVERVEWRNTTRIGRVAYRTVERHGDEHALNAGGWYVGGEAEATR